VFGLFGPNKKQKAMDLAQNGTRAVGTIVNVHDTGVTINDVNVRVGLRFKVEPLDGSAPFEADKKTTVSRVSIPQAGQRFPVWFNPEDHTEFAFAQSDGGAEARQNIVAMFGDAFGADGSGVGQVAAPAAAAPSDPLERLTKLQAMREAGVLNDEEFEEQKRKILADG
jgi:Short C-terminal domain